MSGWFTDADLGEEQAAGTFRPLAVLRTRIRTDLHTWRSSQRSHLVFEERALSLEIVA